VGLTDTKKRMTMMTMANTLDKLPFKLRGRDYNWEAWFDGRAWRLVRGEDYECKTASMRNLVAQTARRRGIRVATQLDGEAVCVQAWPERGVVKVIPPQHHEEIDPALLMETMKGAVSVAPDWLSAPAGKKPERVMSRTDRMRAQREKP
jgi:hypothetical protein